MDFGCLHRAKTILEPSKRASNQNRGLRPNLETVKTETRSVILIRTPIAIPNCRPAEQRRRIASPLRDQRQSRLPPHAIFDTHPTPCTLLVSLPKINVTTASKSGPRKSWLFGDRATESAKRFMRFTTQHTTSRGSPHERHYDWLRD